ncbi:hypothetical protein [Ideonella livida]|uniref:Uncharacterized protein n=1 Tax=Ideonella livida TaxID=2707176 RepID=A0A7C9TNG7_9BURK|nr:hypothetical protein [Ideonella livida]NDY94064.1 hypothetical protein [Ideonella livida]
MFDHQLLINVTTLNFGYPPDDSTQTIDFIEQARMLEAWHPLCEAACDFS